MCQMLERINAESTFDNHLEPVLMLDHFSFINQEKLLSKNINLSAVRSISFFGSEIHGFWCFDAWPLNVVRGRAEHGPGLHLGPPGGDCRHDLLHLGEPTTSRITRGGGFVDINLSCPSQIWDLATKGKNGWSTNLSPKFGTIVKHNMATRFLNKWPNTQTILELLAQLADIKGLKTATENMSNPWPVSDWLGPKNLGIWCNELTFCFSGRKAHWQSQPRFQTGSDFDSEMRSLDVFNQKSQATLFWVSTQGENIWHPRYWRLSSVDVQENYRHRSVYEAIRRHDRYDQVPCIVISYYYSIYNKWY